MTISGHSKKSGHDAARLTNPLPGRPALVMDKNPLLVRATVGKTRPTVYDLPPAGHIYGKMVPRNPLEDASQGFLSHLVVHHWTVKATSKEGIPALDYVTMNRNCLKNGIINPKKMREFWAENPVHIKIGQHANFGKLGSFELGLERRKGPLPSDKNVQFTYGKPTRYYKF